MLGCHSGAIRTVALLGDTGLPAEPNCPVANVSLRRYTGTRDERAWAGLAVKLGVVGGRGQGTVDESGAPRPQRRRMPSL